MTSERMEEICKALLTMGDEAKALCEMEPEDAAKRMTENGFSVTAEELVELSEKADQHVRKIIVFKNRTLASSSTLHPEHRKELSELSAKSVEEAEKMCAECGVDLNSELSDLPEGELSDNQLDAVAGGAVTWKMAKKAFKAGMQAGVVIRNLYDKRNGKPLTYPNWVFEW